MIHLFPRDDTRPLSVLCLGAHCDDIEIGCGGTVRKLVTSDRDVSVFWSVLSSDSVRAEEARVSAAKILDGASDSNVEIEEFRNGYFPFVGSEIKDYFENLKSRIDPDVIFTHYSQDLHQDHRIVSELTWNTFRDHWILEYEIPKYDGDLSSPNFYSPLSAELVEFKISTLMNCFKSQSSKHWFDRATFQALMRLRGLECAAPTDLAEAFYVRKSIIDFG